jgi:hypothetical protein
MNNEGPSSHDQRQAPSSTYIPNVSSDNGGGTYTSNYSQPTVKDYENVFGPSARDIKDDLQRYKRHGRWHLPDILKGPNPWLADRIDGLITDAATSPFTSTILPYKYFDNVDGKLKWNVWSFDEAMASRVPYEAAARTLTQTKRSFSGYAVRHGLAITLEHNFMMTPKGRENFQNQLNQLVGSIQYSNDLDVHMALILAPSYEKHMLEKYNNYNKSATQSCREYIDLFGFMQKNQNALDILIEEAKLKLKLWGGPMPNFLLTNSKLTFQLTMTPERTNYISQGPDGNKRLRQGPDLGSYRGISIIPSRSFSMETGQPPRDMLRRRVRVAEYYRIAPDKSNSSRTFELYNEERDTFFTIAWKDLFRYANFNLPSDASPEVRELHAAIQDNIKYYFDRTNTHSPVGDMGTVPRRRSSNSESGSVPSRKISTHSLHQLLSKHIGHQEWNQLLEAVSTHATDETVLIPHEKIIASFITPKTVFVPFVASLHFDKQEDYMQTIQNIKNNYLQQSIKDSVADYPRTFQTSQEPFTLTHPFSLEQVNKGTVEYNEAKIALGRLFSRYAAPTSYLNVQDKQLTFNMDCLKKNNLSVGDMYYQPLGAVAEPNHPLHSESMTLGKARDVHSSWILTEDILDYLYKQPERWPLAAKIASTVDGTNMSKAAYSAAVTEQFELECMRQGWKPMNRIARKMGVYTWGVTDNYLASTDYLHPESTLGKQFHTELKQYAPNGLVTTQYLHKLVEMGGEHPWLMPATTNGKASPQSVHATLANRLTVDAYAPYVRDLHDSIASDRLLNELLTVKNHDDCTCHTGSFVGALGTYTILAAGSTYNRDDGGIAASRRRHNARNRGVPNPNAYVPDGAQGRGHGRPVQVLPYDPQDGETQDGETQDGSDASGDLDAEDFVDSTHSKHAEKTFENNFEGWTTDDTSENLVRINKKLIDLVHEPVTPARDPQNWEFVIVRPNIEHYMLGIILGLSGDQLGNTLWGQTELSVYDDSQHGVWGMSYKYHERAIVFNEKNLIRLWDIAYDGYNGGKNDTYVEWNNKPDVDQFKEDTNDVTRDYRGKSMMVMAFFKSSTNKEFKTNWPSPIVFYHPQRDSVSASTLSGPENQANVPTKEFQVFDPAIYPAYQTYFKMMPNFLELHQMRKSAAESSKDDETQIDCLAYQGTMRIKSNGACIDTINGSGHHGVDYVGVSSVRAGKGYKMSGGITSLIRQV